MNKGKVYGIIAIKGGVGKTTTVSNLAAIFANEFKKKLVIDANFSAPNLGLHLGIVNPEHTLHDALSNKVNIYQTIQNHGAGFDVIPASLIPKKIAPYDLKKKIKNLRKLYDVILIDSSPSLNEEILATMIASDELLVVSSLDYPTLSCTMHAVKVAKKKKTPITGIIINKARNKNFELKLEDVEHSTETPVLAVLPDDLKILEALAHTTPAAMIAPKSQAVVEYKKLAASLIGEKFKEKGFKPFIKKLFSRGVPKQEVNRQILMNK